MRPERDNRRGGTLLFTLLACGLLTVLHGRAERRGQTDAVSGAVRDMALVPGQTGLALLGQTWHLSGGSLLSGPRLARENEALKARVLDLTAQNKELLSEKSENVRLRGLLGFQQRSRRPLLAAEVVALKPSPHTDTLTLNRGSAQGVHEHSVVVAPNGALIGQVLTVSARACDVLLLTDAESSVGALVHNHTAQGPIGLCQGDGQQRLRVTYLRSDTLLHVGDAVTTSGLGGVFPKADSHRRGADDLRRQNPVTPDRPASPLRRLRSSARGVRPSRRCPCPHSVPGRCAARRAPSSGPSAHCCATPGRRLAFR